MTRSQRLEVVAGYKNKQQQQCLQDMADSKKRWEQQKAQLQNLIDYQDEYHQRHGQTSQVGLSTLQLIEFRRFMDQLEQTIKQQGQIVKQAEREFQIKQQHWLKLKNNAKVVEHLVENIQQQEQEQENKLEQRLLDEFGLRKKTT